MYSSRPSGSRLSSSRPKHCRRSLGLASSRKPKMSFGPHDYLRHILTEVDYLLGVSAGINREQFLGDESLRRAFVRSIEVIGEATKRLPASITGDQSIIAW